MLDKRTAKLLAVLTKICTDESYKVIEVADLIKQMSPRFKVNESNLDQMLEFLSINETINIRYKDKNVYCLTVLPRGRVQVESGPKNNSVVLGRRLASMIVFGSFVAAFLGAALGYLVVGWLC